MKTSTFQSVMTALVMLFSLHAQAYDVEVDGIYYNLHKVLEVGSTATVTYREADTANTSAYSGKVEIPNTFWYNNEIYTVTSISDSAFYACSGLTSISIPANVMDVGYDAFKECTALTSVTIKDGHQPLLFKTDLYNTEQGFFYSSPLETIYMGRDITASACEYYAGEYVSPFRGNATLSSVIIGDKVKEVLHKAFFQCPNLVSVSIGENVKTIRERAFANCTSLASVSIPDSVETIGLCAFNGCTGLTSLTIGSGVKKMDMFAFAWCSNLASLTIKEGVEEIGWSAFIGCSGLTAVVIPNSVKVIGQNAFERCINLTSVSIGQGVTYIGASAFNQCGFTSVVIPKRLKTIEGYTFYGCSSLTSITIPDSVTFIGERAFAGCSGLTSVSIGDGVTQIATAAFESCSSLASIVIPDSVTTIGSSAFNNCWSLVSATIPDGVENIGSGAFQNCGSLVSVSIGKGVKRIGSAAFYDSNALKHVYCYAEDVPLMEYPFPTTLQNATLYVPSASIEAYKAVEPWKDFGTIMALDVEIAPIEKDTEITFSNSITEETDLKSAVIENVYVTLNTDGDDGYDVEERCIVLASTVTEEQLETITDKEVADATVTENYNGLIIEVPAGKGTISITAQTKGNRTVNVKIGGAEAQTFTKPERGVVEVPYTVDKDTYVYIYGAEAASVKSRRAASSDVTDGVLIYCMKWQQDESTAIDAIATNKGKGAYNIYTLDGKQTKTVQKGMNIIRTSDGKVKKVMVK